MARALKAFIDALSLKHNFEHVQSITSNKKVLAMVKANGYGHGVVHVARALKDADAFGVACIEEAVALRSAGVHNRIVLMEGFFNAEDELPEILRLNLEPVIHHEGHLEALRLLSQPIKVWIKINTGMNRLGFKPNKFSEVYEKVSQMTAVKIAGLMTHFATADDINNPNTAFQMEEFFATIQNCKEATSLANSAGILGWKASHGDWVRPGIMLYGVSPFSGRHGLEEGLQPVMSLQSEIIAIQTLKQGESVGYGREFKCPKDMRIGVVAIGYGDGYPRVAPNGTPTLVNGKLAPLVGRVSMDMITVDLSEHPEAEIGDPVQIWGRNLPVETVAEFIGTSAYELLTGLSPRVPFFLIS